MNSMEERLSYDLILLWLKVWKRKGIWKRNEGRNEGGMNEKGLHLAFMSCKQSNANDGSSTLASAITTNIFLS